MAAAGIVLLAAGSLPASGRHRAGAGRSPAERPSARISTPPQPRISGQPHLPHGRTRESVDSASSSQGAGFAAIGSAACRACHRSIWQAWERTDHARATESLTFDQRLDDACRPCHLPHAEVESAVGCEACHGPGSAYADLAVMIDPVKRDSAGLVDAARVCAECHNPNHPFHVERQLEATSRSVHPAPPVRRAGGRR